jgi:peptide/nickel transport system ATP-binding protein
MKPLEVEGLSTTLFTRRGVMKAVDGLSLTVGAGETVALVGESGCGKSLSALSIMRLLPDPPARIVGGQVILNGRDLVPLPEEAMLDIRGQEIGMIFQDPMSSLNPVATVEKQIAEVLMTHTAARPRPGPRPRARAARAGRHAGRRTPARRLSPPALRRHVPEGGDRHGDRLQPLGADRRRADHRARCHRAGAGAGAA